MSGGVADQALSPVTIAPERLEELRRARTANVVALLATRGLRAGEVAELVRARMGDGGTLLFTSSLVHGLANVRSDIDTILIDDVERPEARMATQMFHGTNHLEAIAFAGAEVDDALERLGRLAREPANEVVAELRAWNDRNAVRRKYLERLISGVTVEGTSPYDGSLASLATVWRWGALDSLVRACTWAVLAEAAGEKQGTHGYALNALLSAMDVALSHHGDVYSNRKWYLLRWRRLRPTLDDDDVASAIDALETYLATPLPVGGRSFGQALLALLAGVGRALGTKLGDHVELRLGADAHVTRFLPGASFVVNRGTVSGAIAEGTLDEPLWGSVAALRETDPAVAAAVLCAARAGALTLEAWR